MNNWLPMVGWSSVIGFLIFLIKSGWKAAELLRTIEQKWDTLQGGITSIRTNHLEHIQQATEQTTQALLAHTKAFETSQQEINKTLEKQSEILTALQLVLVDLNGFLRGQASQKY
jgi:hypothetical protein